MKTIAITAAFLAISFSAFSQDSNLTFYLDQTFEVTDSSAVYVQKMNPTGEDSFDCEVYEIESDQLKMEGTYLKVEDEFLENGKFVFYYPSGKVESSGFYVYGYKSGSWKRFDEEGNARAERYYNPKLGERIRKYKEQLKEME